MLLVNLTAKMQRPCPMVRSNKALAGSTALPYRETVTLHAGAILPYLSQATQVPLARLRCIAATNQQVRFSGQAQAKVWSNHHLAFVRIISSKETRMLAKSVAESLSPLAGELDAGVAELVTTRRSMASTRSHRVRVILGPTIFATRSRTSYSTS
jgi:hypothetical protein